ncbi:hypothetical protein GYA13_00250 [Candidatus Kuenenbacteria bacterium]|nr:hypothetical protein [Candidatus Kuenenbacteria bacterium]
MEKSKKVVNALKDLARLFLGGMVMVGLYFILTIAILVEGIGRKKPG